MFSKIIVALGWIYVWKDVNDFIFWKPFFVAAAPLNSKPFEAFFFK